MRIYSYRLDPIPVFKSLSRDQTPIACKARVSWPALARAKPQACRSMWGWAFSSSTRERKRAKTDRLDAAMLMRVFLGWLRGERGHCGMVAIPTMEEEDARRPS